jgi:hypothetical protein
MRNPDIVFGNEHCTGATMDDNGGMHSGKLADVGQLTDSVVVFCPPASKQLNCLGRQDTVGSTCPKVAELFSFGRFLKALGALLRLP